MQSYEEFIDEILESRGPFACGDEYHERHHIVPRCCGGTNDKDNLIDLYAREHFEAHRLLALENPDNNKLVYAWWMMSHMNKSNNRDYEVTAEEYEEAKKSFSILASNNAKQYIGEKNPFYGNHKLAGENNPFYGKKHSDETRKQLSEMASFRVGEKNPFFGKHHTEESKEANRRAHLGKHLSDESKIKISKRVNQYDINGNFIMSYNSITEAANAVDTSKQNISMVLRKITSTAKGFIWFYADDPIQPDKSKIITNQND